MRRPKHVFHKYALILVSELTETADILTTGSKRHCKKQFDEWLKTNYPAESQSLVVVKAIGYMEVNTRG